MRRNLKALLLAAMAVGAMSAIGASAANATEFDCAVANCKISTEKDGSGTTAHHVFDAPGNGPITCSEGKFSATGQPAESTSMQVSVSYSGCEFLGQPALVQMNGCEYLLTAHGAISITCPAGKEIEFGILNCVGTVRPQALTGITDSGEVGQVVTVSANVTGTHVVMEGVLCITEGTFTTGRYTTGNTLVTGATASDVMVDVDWDTATSD